MAANEAKRTTISVLKPTKDALDSIKHEGQSYDGIIQDLMNFWKDKKKDYWTRRERQKQAR
ncbi:hypothetical protein ES703_121041 [subsurface metagenome]